MRANACWDQIVNVHFHVLCFDGNVLIPCAEDFSKTRVHKFRHLNFQIISPFYSAFGSTLSTVLCKDIR